MRYGRIDYVNVAPVETAFDRGALVRDVDVVRAVPTRLNAQLGAGELDVAAISTAYYLAHRDTLVRVGDLGIVAAGPVRSVLLVSSIAPALLDGQTIAVTSHSASSVALLDALLSRVQRVRAEYDVVDDALAAARAGRPALVIGDAALEARATLPPRLVHDLGEAWQVWTGLPMVFAVWAARRDVAEREPEAVGALTAALTDARAWGHAHLDAVIDAAVAARPAHRALYADYFTRLSYTIDARAEAGLAHFAGLTEGVHVAR